MITIKSAAALFPVAFNFFFLACMTHVITGDILEGDNGDSGGFRSVKLSNNGCTYGKVSGKGDDASSSDSSLAVFTHFSFVKLPSLVLSFLKDLGCIIFNTVYLFFLKHDTDVS